MNTSAGSGEKTMLDHNTVNWSAVALGVVGIGIAVAFVAATLSIRR